VISIIITSFKEPKTIGRAIEAILYNKIKDNFELIISAPDKETLAVASAYAKKNKKIRLLKDSGKGKPAALNLILKKAKGEILVLTDGDVYIDKNAIQPLLDKLKDQRVGAVSGHPLSLNSRKTKLGYWSHLLTDMVNLWRKKGKFVSCSGYLYAARKKLLKPLPQETLSDDAYNSYIIAEQGYAIAYASNSFVYIKYPTTFSDWIKQKKRSGGGYNQLEYLLKNKSTDRTLIKESSGIFQVLNYPKTFIEFIWTLELILARAYLWTLIFWDINIKKKDFKKIWVRVESTK